MRPCVNLFGTGPAIAANTVGFPKQRLLRSLSTWSMSGHGSMEAATSPSNLALACPDCNRHKGPNLSAIDPETVAVVSLFHPREHLWNEHFAMVGARIEGITAVGRATAELLDMNNDERVEMRAELQDCGEM